MRKKKILIADEDNGIRSLTEAALLQQGFEVLQAEDGAHALRLINLNHPDFVFLDESLPGLDGYHLCDQIKSQEDLKGISVVLLGSKSKKKQKGKTAKTKGDGFLFKPFNREELLAKVEELLYKKLFHESSSEEPTSMSDSDLTEVEGATATEETLEPGITQKQDDSQDTPLTPTPSVQGKSSKQGSPHDFNWFMSEMKRETGLREQKPEPSTSVVEEKTLEEPTSGQKADEEEAKGEIKVEEIEDNILSGDFFGESKEQVAYKEIELEDEKKPQSSKAQSPADKIISELIQSISTKIAQEIAQKIDPEFLKNLLKEKIQELKKP